MHLALACAPAQEPEATAGRLQLATDPPAVAAAVRAAEAVLLAHRDRALAPRQATGPLLAWLWLGRDDAARDLLRRDLARLQAPAGATGTGAARSDDAWTILHHAYYLRATGDTGFVRAHGPWLDAACRRLANAPLDRDLAAATCTLHAVACGGGILDSLDRLDHPAAWGQAPPVPSPGASQHLRAAALRSEFERRFWSPVLGAFAGDGDDVSGDRGLDVAAALHACWIGMLATTGDRTTANAVAALRQHGRTAPRPSPPADLLLLQAMATVATAQFDGDAAAAMALLLHLAADDRPPTAPRADDELLATGAAVDALLFALTGVRLATGPGIDEDWIRLRPRLPPDGLRVRFAGLRHDRWRGTLELERRTAAPDAAERDLLRRCGDAEAGAAQARVAGTFALDSPDPPNGGHRVVLHLADRTLLAPLRRGERLEFAHRLP